MARKVDHAVGGDCMCAAAIALRVQVAELQAEVALLRQQVAVGTKPVVAPRRGDGAALVAGTSRDDVVRQRVDLFRSLFAGRDGVYAQRWEKDGKSGWAPQIDRMPGQSWQDAREARQYRSLTDAVLQDHLAGKITAGVYPMLADDTCRLLVCDFDGAQWRLDAQAYAQVAAAVGVLRSARLGNTTAGRARPVRMRSSALAYMVPAGRHASSACRRQPEEARGTGWVHEGVRCMAAGQRGYRAA